MIKERDINGFLNGRQFFILTAVLLIALTWVASYGGRLPMQGSTSGVCFSSASVLGIAPAVSMTLNLLGLIGICVLLTFLNKTYSFIRDVTYIFASSFMLLGVACPYVSTHLYDGTLLCLVTLALAFLLFGTYQSPYPQRRVFLISAILSSCCMFQYAFVYLIPVFFFGFLQMRAMLVRSALAMLFGLITPFWIVLGTGWVEIDALRPPEWVNIWNNLDLSQSGFLIGTVGVTAFVTLVLLVRNVLQIINYKMQVRAYNGFFLVLTICTMIVMAVDYNNIFVYLPVLNVCFAVQMGHAFTIKKYLRRYIAYLLFVAVCIGVYVWRVLY